MATPQLKHLSFEENSLPLEQQQRDAYNAFMRSSLTVQPYYRETMKFPPPHTLEQQLTEINNAKDKFAFASALVFAGFNTFRAKFSRKGPTRCEIIALLSDIPVYFNVLQILTDPTRAWYVAKYRDEIQKAARAKLRDLKILAH